MVPVEPMLPLDIAPEPADITMSLTKSRRPPSDSSSVMAMEDMSASSLSASFQPRRGSTASARRPPPRKLFNLPGVGVARRTLGLACLLATVFLWTTSNFLASYIFSDNTYDKPFFLVYVNTSMFALSMIPLAIQHVRKNGGFAVAAAALRRAWREGSLRPLSPEHMRRATQGAHEYEDYTAGERLLPGDEEAGLGDGDRPSDDADKTAATAVARRGSSGGSSDKPGPDGKLSLRETARLSLEFSMLWFLANYLSSACLKYTSVGSTTILTSTSSVWTLVMCAWLRVEQFSWRKLVGVLASLAGIILISSIDLGGADNDDSRGNFPHKTQRQIAIGDVMALVSAFVYGVYITVMKVRVGDEERVNMPLFFGIVGCLNIALLWPLFFVLHFTGIETFEMPPTGQIWAIILLNSVSSFFSDMSWAYATLLTTPLIVTVGLSLTIPLSLIGEMIQYQQFSSFLYWVGAGIVLLSFLFINHESQGDGTAPTSTSLGQSPGLDNSESTNAKPGSGTRSDAVLLAADQQDPLDLDDDDDDSDPKRVHSL